MPNDIGVHMAELSGKVALVTGGGRGIGRATAVELARAGADVAVVARSATEVQAVAAEIAQLAGQGAGRAVPLTIDLAERDAPQKLIAKVEAELGPVAVLVNNAALAGPFGPTWEVEPDAWEQALHLNLTVPFRLIHAVLPQMQAAGWGRIINISSGAARNPLERAGAYSVSKAGLDMLTRQLGLELADTGIAVICVYPGVVDTTMQTTIREQPQAIVGQAVAQRFQEFYTSGSLQAPERPARLIAALATAAGAEFNGQIVDIYSEQGQQLVAAGG
jgi:NAD(P)-dependent dehydrogenase (short-subunit alcohol dehydrogenase family)